MVNLCLLVLVLLILEGWRYCRERCHSLLTKRQYEALGRELAGLLKELRIDLEHAQHEHVLLRQQIDSLAAASGPAAIVSEFMRHAYPRPRGGALEHIEHRAHDGSADTTTGERAKTARARL